MSEIIEDGVHGSVVDLANDIASLGDAIQFWSEPARRGTAKSAIIELALQFDISKNVGQTLAILVQAAVSAASTVGKI